MQKVIEFFLEAKSELSKVVWPNKTQTLYYTGVVIGVSLVIAIVLGAADFGLLRLLQEVVNR
jgi:preprotein translocase SecE subunit